MSIAWSAEQYARHAGPRLRPAIDLLARVPLAAAGDVVDLGCGGGALFPLLRARFPEARLTGVDLSADMLRAARAVDADAALVEADLCDWRPPAPVDLIIANAVLHWVPTQLQLLPDLLRRCRVLAIQIPDNFAAPSHRLVGELMREPAWAGRLGSLRLADRVASAPHYREILAGAGAAAVEVWQTTYFHALEGDDPVLDWLRGTTLLPVYAALGGRESAQARAFEAMLADRLRRAYPAAADGATLYPFRRLFCVAVSRVRPQSTGTS